MSPVHVGEIIENTLSQWEIYKYYNQAIFYKKYRVQVPNVGFFLFYLSSLGKIGHGITFCKYS